MANLVPGHAIYYLVGAANLTGDFAVVQRRRERPFGQPSTLRILAENHRQTDRSTVSVFVTDPSVPRVLTPYSMVS